MKLYSHLPKELVIKGTTYKRSDEKTPPKDGRKYRTIHVLSLNLRRYGEHKPTEWIFIEVPKFKSIAAHQVLKLMDNDVSYMQALKQVLESDNTLNKKQLEKELNFYI